MRVTLKPKPRRLGRQDYIEACWRTARRAGLAFVKVTYVAALLAWTLAKGVGKGLLHGEEDRERR